MTSVLLHNFIVDNRTSNADKDLFSNFNVTAESNFQRQSSVRPDANAPEHDNIPVALVSDNNETKPTGRPINVIKDHMIAGKDLRELHRLSLSVGGHSRPARRGVHTNSEGLMHGD